tara:strand:- start:502 stop:1017 length:516 start_codon:yes stop_codon:yes gene_type:complete
MERRLNKKISDYVHNFKTSLAEKIQAIPAATNQSELSELVNYIYQYDNFELDKDDFMKRKRVKSTVPIYERCCAKRASGEQCTRRKKDECQYCGTHSKGTPHGMMSDQEPVSTTKKVDVNAIDIKGIVYYLDDSGNVYDTEDVIANIKNPRIIAKYEKNGDEYSIPELFGK